MPTGHGDPSWSDVARRQGFCPTRFHSMFSSTGCNSGLRRLFSPVPVCHPHPEQPILPVSKLTAMRWCRLGRAIAFFNVDGSRLAQNPSSGVRSRPGCPENLHFPGSRLPPLSFSRFAPSFKLVLAVPIGGTIQRLTPLGSPASRNHSVAVSEHTARMTDPRRTASAVSESGQFQPVPRVAGFLRNPDGQAEAYRHSRPRLRSRSGRPPARRPVAGVPPPSPPRANPRSRSD